MAERSLEYNGAVGQQTFTIVTLGCGGLLASRYGLEGMAIGLAIGAAAFSIFYLPLRAWRIISRDGWEKTDLDPLPVNDEL
jgi:hypothetical protein